MILKRVKYGLLTGLFLMTLLVACSKDDGSEIPTDDNDDNEQVDDGEDQTTLDDGPIDFSLMNDTYGELASADQVYSWRHYNVHDPALLDDGKFVYSYSTDVAFGHDIRPGHQIRRSINMVEWEFVGWVFPGLPTAGANYIRQNGGEPFNALWAPYAIKVGDEYRVYYSLSSETPRLSVIGLAVSDSPKGPFQERGLVVTSKNDNTRQTNAIDPTVIVGKDGRHWMYYGSAWDGIYIVELNPTTGLTVSSSDKGRRIAQRAFTGDRINGNIEGPEVIYNEEFDMYYLFIAYDWLETKYNVRVGRSSDPNGPFVDINGNDMNEEHDDMPMILAPYRFDGHSGWQGVSHPGVVKRDGSYYMAHQGRPGENRFYMVMHTRQIFWTEDGWPMVSSQRFAGEEEAVVEESELIGEWEYMPYTYQVVPGYAEEQINPNFITSQTLTLSDNGTFNGDANNTWSYSAPWLTMNWGGQDNYTLRIERGRDWENVVESTILFTGLNEQGNTAWAKKLN